LLSTIVTDIVLIGYVSVTSMLDFQIHFDFQRHADGYAVVQPEGAPAGGMIVPKGRALLPSPPFEKFDTLYSVFAEIRDLKALLDFVSKFGLLMGRGDDLSQWGDSIAEALREAQFFRELLACKKRNQKAVYSGFRDQLRTRQEAEYDGINVKLPPKAEPWKWQMMVGNLVDVDDLHQFVGRVELIPDSVTGIKFRIITNTLISALWWQLARKLSGDAKIRECRHCKRWFEAGVGTTRRADSQFCSPEHKVRFFSLKRARGR
jgi:hypothetical protein